MKKLIEGKLYKIRFYDHCFGSADKMICEVAGWITSEDKLSLVLTPWKVDTKCKKTYLDNLEPITIMKSCIIRSRKLE